MLNLTPLLDAIAREGRVAAYQITTAPGGGDSGYLLWVDSIAHDFDDTTAGPGGGAAAGRIPQTSTATLVVRTVFGAPNIGQAHDQLQTLGGIVGRAANAALGPRGIKRWRLDSGQLDVQQGAAARYSAAVTVTVFDL